MGSEVFEKKVDVNLEDFTSSLCQELIYGNFDIFVSYIDALEKLVNGENILKNNMNAFIVASLEGLDARSLSYLIVAGAKIPPSPSMVIRKACWHKESIPLDMR